MKKRIERLRGMHDLLPEEYQRQRRVIERLATCLARAGYSPVDAPVLEQSDLFHNSFGQELWQNLYAFRLHHRDLCLRPEYTASICRLYLDRTVGGSRDVNACGFAFGIDRLLSLLPGDTLPLVDAIEALVIPVSEQDMVYALQVARVARIGGMTTEVDVTGHGVGAGLKLAAKKRARLALNVQSGEHVHAGRQSDTILEGSQVGYWLMLLAVSHHLRYDDMMPHLAILQGYAEFISPVQECLDLLRAGERDDIVRGLRTGFALVGWACARAGVSVLAPAQYDLEQMRRKGLVE